MEMFWPFVGGVAIFTILFIAGGQLFVVTRMITEDNTPVSLALYYLANSMPAILVFTFPMAVLLGALLAFGRLSGESELTALKAGGISFLRTAFPGLMLTLFITFIALVINNLFAPNATYIAQNILFEQLMKNQDMIRENLVIKENDEEGMERVVFSRKLLPRENRMEDATIQYYKGRVMVRQVRAKDVYYKPSEGKWFLKLAYIEDYAKGPEPGYFSVAREVYLPLKKSPDQLAARERRPEEMNREQLAARLDQMETEGFENENEHKKYREYEVYYHQKIAIPFTCFVFGMFGIPLGVRPNRTNRAVGLGISIIFIFLYYVLMSIGMAMGRNGLMPTFWAAWMPNMVFAVAGMVLLIKVGKQ